MVGWECPTNPREASGLDPEAVHTTNAYLGDHQITVETDSDSETTTTTVTDADGTTTVEVTVSGDGLEDPGDDPDDGDDDDDDEDDDDPGDTPGDVPTWNPDDVYTEGDRVSWDGSIWEAQWWTQDQEPGASQWGPWEEVGDADEPSDEPDDDPDDEPDDDPDDEPDDDPDDPDDEPSDLMAELEPSTTSASVGDRITFSVEDTSGSGRWIDSLEFDFGDGSTATGWWAEHSYDSAGTYTVELTATDGDGATTTDEVTITVS